MCVCFDRLIDIFYTKTFFSLFGVTNGIVKTCQR